MAASELLERVCVVLVATRNPLNIGAAARAMSNFGFSRLRVVNPYEPGFREARSAVGAASLLASAEQFGSIAEAVADCTMVVGTTAGRNRELHQPLRSLRETAPIAVRELRSGRVALLFGSEKVGLSTADLTHCHCLLRVPTRTEHPSMNLGQAVSVCLYELLREIESDRIGGPAVDSAREPRATSAALERITDLLLSILRASGYVEAHGASTMQDKLRRLVRRMDLSNSDAELWLGMLRQIAWQLRLEGPL